MSGPLAIFKCAFGGADGWGHVTRCGALASVFRKRGWRALLWTESDPAGLTRETAASFATVARGPEIPAVAREASVLVVDEMYTPDEAFAALRSRWPARSLFVGIDDMQRRSMAAFDLAINTEIGLRRANYASPHCLLGERYALLREGFCAPEEVVDFHPPGGCLPVFAMLGGTDAFGYTPRVLESLAAIGANRFAPVVALGAASGSVARVRELLARFPEGQLLERLESPQLAGWMRRCAFGIIACGTSLFEAAAMGLPFVGISLVDNQTATARQVARQWGMPVLYREGRHEEPLDLAGAVEQVGARREELSLSAYSEVDAGGAERVVGSISTRSNI